MARNKFIHTLTTLIVCTLLVGLFPMFLGKVSTWLVLCDMLAYTVLSIYLACKLINESYPEEQINFNFKLKMKKIAITLLRIVASILGIVPAFCFLLIALTLWSEVFLTAAHNTFHAIWHEDHYK